MTYERYFLAAVVSYLLGTVPSAVWIVKAFTGKRILEEGTGNPGTVNSFEVTGKKSVGLIVLILDALKGAVSVLLCSILFGAEPGMPVAATFFAVCGHNFNVFLKFKGGRGLATAFGCFAVLSPVVFAVWLAVYFGLLIPLRRNIYIGTIVSTVLTAPLLFLMPESVAEFASAIALDQSSIVCTVIIAGIPIIINNIRPLIAKR